MIEDYSEINDIEVGCDFVPWDMFDLDEELPVSEVVDEDVIYARYRRVKSSEICDNSRCFDFRGELYERLS